MGGRSAVRRDIGSEPVDDRLKGLREGAGLEESRLNQEFLGWLNRWGNRLLWLALIALGLYVGNIQLGKMGRTKVDRAFSAYQEVLAVDPTPERLVEVAQQHSGIRSVALMARLQAADLYLQSVRRGLVPGATVGEDGSVLTSEDLLTDDRRTWSLDRAQELYQGVFDAGKDDPGMVVHAIGAGFGLAAIAESRFDGDGARTWYERVAELGDKFLFPEAAAEARARIERLADLASMAALYERASLPQGAIITDGSAALDLQQLISEMQVVEPTQDTSSDDPASDPAGDAGDGSGGGDPAGGGEPGSGGDAGSGG